MVTILLYYFLLTYFFFLFTVGVFTAINVGHLVKTGTFTLVSLIVTIIFLALMAITLWLTWFLLKDIDWQQTVVLWNSDWLNNLFSFSGSSL